jgi:cation diffusion facilitator CzcD-associated flavoprotein CzcO
VKYLQGVCNKYQIIDKIQLNTAVQEAHWNESEQIWEVTIQYLTEGSGELTAAERRQKELEQGRDSVIRREERIRTKILISAVGGLVEPRTLTDVLPGRDKFQGDIFHSARWKYDIDLKDKNVVVVGTGCSAAQFVPRLTKVYGAKSVTQLMRSPPWVVPRPIPPMGEENWEKWAPWLNTNVPMYGKSIRWLTATLAEFDWRLFGTTEYAAKERAKVEAELLKHMKKTVPLKYHEMLTPDYGVCCKRRIFDASWFPGLNDENIELTTLPLTSLGENTVTLGPGRTYPPQSKIDSKVPNDEVTIPCDTLILANGFDVAKWLHPMDIYGRQGATLQSVFESRGGPQMYMGLAMDEFPNFYTIIGPNTITGHSSVIMATENMVNLTLKLIKPILKGDVNTVEIKKEAEVAWAEDIQRACKNTVWSKGGCQSWYTANDWNSTVFPYVLLFWEDVKETSLTF